MSPRSTLQVYSREQIYELVWSKAMKHAGPELGISDVALRKICLKHKIPIPPQGYWAKKAAGHFVFQPALKAVSDPDMREVRIDKGNYDQSESMTKNRIKLVEHEDLRDLIAFEEIPANKITVPDRIVNPHPVVRSTRIKKKIRGSKSHESVEDKVWKNVSLSIDVSDACYPRAERIFHAFIKALTERGHTLKVVKLDQSQYLKYIVLNEQFEIRIRESVRMIRPDPSVKNNSPWSHPGVTYEHKGELQLILSTDWNRHTKTWKDNNSRGIEEVLNDVIIWMFIYVDILRKERIQEEIREKEQRRLEEQRQENQLRRERDSTNIERLLKLGVTVRTLETLNGFVTSLRTRLNELSPESPEYAKITSWIEQADPYIQQLDPLRNLDALPVFVTRESQVPRASWRFD